MSDCYHHVYGTYVSEFEESVILQDDIWIESYQPSTGTGYFKSYNVFRKKRARFLAVNNVADYSNLGKFSQIDYDHGTVLIDGESFVYLAFYFSTYTANNFLEVCVPRESDLSKYTFCVAVPACASHRTFAQWVAIAKAIKAQIVRS